MTGETLPAIEPREVTKAFGDLVVLDQVSLAAPAGRGFCILGRSGTGKSVMLKHIIGLMKPDAGRVLVEGHDITGLSSRAPIRQRIGPLFQNAALFDSITGGENVAFPPRGHAALADDEIRSQSDLLCSRGLASSASTRRCPPNCRAACASALGWRAPWRSNRRSCWPTNPGLDPVTAGEIDALVIELKRRSRTTLVVVTHNTPCARDWRRAVVSPRRPCAGAGHGGGARTNRARKGPRVHRLDWLGLTMRRRV